MILYSACVKRIAVFAVGLLLSAQLAPSAVLACEGEAEEIVAKHISLKPVLWSEGMNKNCPKNLLGLGKKVVFTALNQWCEYEFKNENAAEKVVLSSVGLKFKENGECERKGGKLCLEFVGVPAAHTECNRGLVVPAGVGNECFLRLEYLKKPAAQEEMGLQVIAETLPGRVSEPVEQRQIVK